MHFCGLKEQLFTLLKSSAQRSVYTEQLLQTVVQDVTVAILSSASIMSS